MIGRTLAQYRILDKLGEGGMGAVYVAEDTELRRKIALKVLPPEMAADSDRLRRFKQEARAVAALNHPNIVHVYSVEENEGLHFITMELVEGRTLGEILGRDGLSAKGLLEYAVPLADAVAAAHKRGIVHRDLKPDNVMLDREGRLKVLDFGLAKLEPVQEGAGTMATAEATVTAQGKILGTVAYMSPEQAQGKSVDARSDVFSLGILIYEMATGRRPFQGDNNLSILTAIMRDQPEPVTVSSPDSPRPLDDIVRKCLKKDPVERYASAAELKVDLERLRAEVFSGASSVSSVAAGSSRRTRSRRGLLWAGACVVVVALLVTLVMWNARRTARIDWARTVAIPRIEELHGQASWIEWGTRAWEAHELATEAAAYIGDDPSLASAWDSVAATITIRSDPTGADVWGKPYTDPDGEWRPIGRTPLESIRAPRGLSRVKIELAGHRTAYDLLVNVGFDSEWTYALEPEASLPEEMVFVPGGEHDLYLPGIDHLKTEPTRDFLMDRYEVTNREYKAFVDAGGYENREYWTNPLTRDGEELSWEEAMAAFRDTTGRPGPAGWEVGDYPEGRDAYPVSGVSWYEAAAYASWADKSLPTIFHWNQVALTRAAGEIVPLANFGTPGATPTGSQRVLHRHGVYDLAGNVREWVVNATLRDDGHFVLGGGWNDPGYAFNDAYAQSAWDRSPTNGFRCIRYLDDVGETAALARMIELPFRDFYNEEPASEETFAIWLKQYDYDATPLEATIDAEQEHEDWIRQTVSFNAAYGGERMTALLFLPKTPGPHPAVVYFPGSGAIHTDSSAKVDGRRFDFLMKSGRAVMLPIYKGTYERGDELSSDYPEETNFYKDHVIMWAKDLSRSIDYMETREDLDTSRLVFCGFSWGGVMGTILPAIEPRIKVNVLYVAGLLFQRALPEVDQINYVGRVRQPTLMVNGEFDFFFPVETAQKPLYDLLGAPEGDKRYVVYPGSHAVPRSELIKEILGWLDRYAG